MDTLSLKLVVTPVLIAAASLAGQTVSGWFVGLPLTSGPVAFFVALDYGVGFAAATAVGALAAATAEAAFCLAYAYTARRARWPGARVAGCAAFAMTAGVLQPLSLPMIVFVALAVALRFMPRGSEAAVTRASPRWDLPVRMVTVTLVVVFITEATPALGPRLSGVLGAFPVYAAILTVFGHRAAAGSAVQVLRGLLLGLFGFAGFFLVLGLLIEHAGLALAFTGAIATTLAIQMGSLALVLRSPKGLGA